MEFSRQGLYLLLNAPKPLWLVRADLSGADLRWADLFKANVIRANLSSADLRWVNLGGADLSGADLTEANLRGAEMQGARLNWANLNSAELYEANLQSAHLVSARLESALGRTGRSGIPLPSDPNHRARGAHRYLWLRPPRLRRLRDLERGIRLQCDRVSISQRIRARRTEGHGATRETNCRSSPE